MDKGRENKKQFVIWSFVLLLFITLGIVFPSLLRLPQYSVPVLSGEFIFLFNVVREAVRE